MVTMSSYFPLAGTAPARFALATFTGAGDFLCVNPVAAGLPVVAGVFKIGRAHV
jgi:hypothetical protein